MKKVRRRRKKEEEEKPKANIKEKVSEMLELPREIVLDIPKLVFVGNKELSIENYKGIIEYSENIIRINTNTHMLKITGYNLEIKTITEEEVLVNGNIAGLEFIA